MADSTTALEVSNLTKTYKNGFTALKGVNLSVQQGDFFALLGANGAGKTTLLSIVTSLVNKTTGDVLICGHNLDTDTFQAKKQLGVVPQEFNFNVFEKVIDIITQQAGYYGISHSVALTRAEKYLKALDLWEKRDTPSGMLSGGMKRRLMIARALVHEPNILILDEPTAGVDVELRRSMWEFLTQLNDEGTTIILTTHYLEEAENLAKHIAIIAKGEIIEYSTKRDLLNKSQKQTYLIEIEEQLSEVPVVLSGFEIADEQTLKVTVDSNNLLNDYIKKLVDLDLTIQSIRPESNRLEELFMNYTS